MIAPLSHTDAKLITDVVIANDLSALRALCALCSTPGEIEALASLIRKETHQ